MATERWKFRLDAEFGYRDITDKVRALVEKSAVTDGIVAIAVVGSISTIEHATAKSSPSSVVPKLCLQLQEKGHIFASV